MSALDAKQLILDRALAKSWVLPFAQPSQDLSIAMSDRVERECDANLISELKK